jgi:hypothetical protein
MGLSIVAILLSHTLSILLSDWKDFYLVKGVDEWQTMTIPNDRELQAYRPDVSERPFLGLLALCLETCDWGKCPEGDVREDGIQTGMVAFRINGVDATNATKFGPCIFPQHGDSPYWTPNENGRFTVETKVATGTDFIRFSSFVLW